MFILLFLLLIQMKQYLTHKLKCKKLLQHKPAAFIREDE